MSTISAQVNLKDNTNTNINTKCCKIVSLAFCNWKMLKFYSFRTTWAWQLPSKGTTFLALESLLTIKYSFVFYVVLLWSSFVMISKNKWEALATYFLRRRSWRESCRTSTRGDSTFSQQIPSFAKTGFWPAPLSGCLSFALIRTQHCAVYIYVSSSNK